MPIRPLFTAAFGILAAALALVYGRAEWAVPLLIGGLGCMFAALFPIIFARGRLRRIAASLLAFASGLVLMAAVFWRADVRICEIETRYTGEVRPFSLLVTELPERYQNSARVTVEILDGSGTRASIWCYGEIAALVDVGDRLHGDIAFSATRNDPAYGTYQTVKGIFLSGTPESLEWDAVGEKTLKNLPQRVRRTMLETIDTVFGEAAPTMRALLLGDRTEFDEAFSDAVADTGVSHIFAVSGTHLTFFTAILLLFSHGRRRNFVIASIISLAFAAVTGFTASIVRAMLVQILFFSAAVFGRKSDGLTSLGLALAVLLLQNPYAVADIGLQLSFASVLGILLFAQRLIRCISSRTKAWPRWLAKPISGLVTALALTLSAQVFTMPLVAFYFGSISLISILTNLVVLWVIELLFLFGWLALGTAFVWMPLASLLAAPVVWISGLLEAAIRISAAIPFASLGTESIFVRVWILLLCGLTVWLLLRPRLRTAMAAILLATISLQAALFAMHRYAASAMEIAALDVGYGRCIVITCGEDTIVVDCGSTRGSSGEVLAEHLKARNIRDIDLLIVSTNKPHHANGIAEVLPIIREIAFAPANGDQLLTEELCLRAENAGIELHTLADGAEFTVGTLSAAIYLPADRPADASAAVCVRSAYGEVVVFGDHSERALAALAEDARIGTADAVVSAGHAIKFPLQEEMLVKMQAEYVIICSNKADETFVGARNTAAEGTIRLRLEND
ncbi:MAG: hypothetical protein E7452_09025 [Ruminococcaceae bacterium]|nr:hypothetical protein [Oscillospiraceae bacterium]